MPAVSFYLKKDLLDAVRAKAKARNVPASRIIQEAVEQYLSLSEKRRAKERVLGFLVREKPLGGMEGWGKKLNEGNMLIESCFPACMMDA